MAGHGAVPGDVIGGRLTPAERSQLTAILTQAEALDSQAEAIRAYAAGLIKSVEAALLGGERARAPESVPENGDKESDQPVRRQYLAGQQLLEGSSRIRAPRPATGERPPAGPDTTEQP